MMGVSSPCSPPSWRTCTCFAGDKELALRRLQCLVQVRDDVVDVLQAHGHSDQIGVTPAANCSFEVSCECVVDAG